MVKPNVHPENVHEDAEVVELHSYIQEEKPKTMIRPCECCYKCHHVVIDAFLQHTSYEEGETGSYNACEGRAGRCNILGSGKTTAEYGEAEGGSTSRELGGFSFPWSSFLLLQRLDMKMVSCHGSG